MTRCFAIKACVEATFRKPFFNICGLSDLVQIVLPGSHLSTHLPPALYTVVQSIHCRHWDTLDPELVRVVREETLAWMETFLLQHLSPAESLTLETVLRSRCPI